MESINSSFFIGTINNFLKFTQAKSVFLTDGSLFLKNIDNLMMAFVILLLLLSTFISSGIIGALGLAAFGMLVLKKLLVQGEKIEITPLNIPILLYFTIALISVCFSSELVSSLKGLSKMVVYFSCYMVFLDLFKNNPKRCMYFLCSAAAIVGLEALYGMHQYICGVDPLASWQDMSAVNDDQVINRIYGTLKPYNPNLLGGYLVAGIGALSGFAFWDLLNKKYLKTLGWAFLLVTTLVAIIFTGCRGAYLASGAAAVLFAAISAHIIWNDVEDNKILKNIYLGCLFSGLAALIGLILFSPSVSHRIATIFTYREDSSTSFRINVYGSCLKMFMDNPLIGIGPGNVTFRHIYGLYMRSGFDALGAYSVPLEIAVESGIFALLAFLWFLIGSFVKGAQAILKQGCLSDKILIMACLVTIGGMMVHGLFDTVWYRPQIQILFWLHAAVLVSVVENMKNNQINLQNP